MTQHTNNLMSAEMPTGATTSDAYNNTKPSNPIAPYQATGTTDAQGTFAYDNLDRVSRTTYADGAVITYTYDPNGNPTARADRVGSWSSSYDEANRLTSSSGPGENVTYAYDPVGNLTELTEAGGTTPFGNVFLGTDLSRACAVHDACYDALGDRGISRLRCDVVFDRVLLEECDGVSSRLAGFTYSLGVDVGTVSTFLEVINPS